MVKFSIIIPVYNAEKTIHTCLERIVRQTYSNYEIVIVNDGSKDGSLTVINNFISFHPKHNISVISQHNSGAGAARNTGIEKASGDYIVFIDADDYVDEQYLEEIDKLISEKNADVVFVDIVREDETGKILRYEHMSDFKGLPKDRMIRWQLTGKMPWGGWRKVVRASIIKEHNLRYATTIKVGEESIFSYRILELANVLDFQTSAYYHYVENSSSLTSNDSVENSLQVFSFINKYFKDNNINSYDATIRAMAMTMMAVVINVAYQNQPYSQAKKQIKDLMYEYRPYYSGIIDTDALDTRVKIVSPFIKMGWTWPVFIASKLQSLKKKLS